jgi:hypothetical protein
MQGPAPAMEPYIEDFRGDDGVMHVRLSGTYPKERLASRRNLFEPLVDACQKDKCRAAIVDARDLRVNFDTVALFRAGVDAASLNRLDLCIALVAREDQISPFFDDVLHNRGARVEVFTDMERARSWVRDRPLLAVKQV